MMLAKDMLVGAQDNSMLQGRRERGVWTKRKRSVAQGRSLGRNVSCWTYHLVKATPPWTRATEESIRPACANMMQRLSPSIIIAARYTGVDGVIWPEPDEDGLMFVGLDDLSRAHHIAGSRGDGDSIMMMARLGVDSCPATKRASLQQRFRVFRPPPKMLRCRR
nr:hypothetical protein CFP56_12284 [Quercus suber]